jgi:hypothetical protein
MNPAEPNSQQKSEMSGSPWVKEAENHWEKFCPKMYAELKSEGLLRERAIEAAEQTQNDLLKMVNDEGLDYQSAWEAVRERYLFLPSEQDAEDQEPNPDNLQQEQEPETTTESPSETTSESVESEPSTEPTSLPLEP